MKRPAAVGVALAMATPFLLTACGGDGDDTENDADDGDGYRVVNVLNGPLGDQSFFDDAARGMELIEERGIAVRNIEGQLENPAQWRSNLESVSGGEWDIVVVGSTQMHDILDQTAVKYPDQSYIIYDDVVEQPNVASISYMQNEGSFLAGVLAALVTTNPEQFPNATGSGVVGLVGGMDLPVIRDFLAGFEAGVHAVDPGIEVLSSFVGDFADSNKGHDQATAMFEQGADVVFQVAGGAGVGVLKAAADSERYAIGVDSNQNATHEGYILASMLKNIGISLDSAVAAAQEGSLEFGATTKYGLANDGVSLTYEDNGDVVPQEIQDRVAEYAQMVVDGEIEVPTVL